MVDSDLRRPTLHRLFKVSNTRGLTTALVEGLSFAEVAQPTAVPKLSVLPSGPLPPNPAELVGSHRMRECLQAAAESFDLVVCDSPPIMAVGDAAALAAQCDGVILVIRAGKTAHDILRRVVEQIEAVKGRILGVLAEPGRPAPRRLLLLPTRPTSATTEPMRAARSADPRRPRPPGGRPIRAVTLDCWGTLFLDGPGSDDRYKRQRLAGMQATLAGVGVTVAPAQLDRGYAAAARRLGASGT